MNYENKNTTNNNNKINNTVHSNTKLSKITNPKLNIKFDSLIDRNQ